MGILARSKSKPSSKKSFSKVLTDYKQSGILNIVEVFRGYSSVVERNLAKVDVARSNRVTRF